jgi:ribosomal protein S12 methylthiotransferase accessory factor
MLAPPAARVPQLLSAPGGRRGKQDGNVGLEISTFVEGVLRMRQAFGITRVGTITRLDQIGVPVVQVVRPRALSNAVNQGKGLDIFQAAASALMEAIETWAAERIPKARLLTAPAATLGPHIGELYSDCANNESYPDWSSVSLTWIEGWDLFTGEIRPVPLALVDAVYTVPSPHPSIFPRTTTGLGAGSTMLQAVVHAALEILERDAKAQAHKMPHFFDRYQIDVTSVQGRLSSAVLEKLGAANMLTGVWRIPSAHDLPIYWCHIMEDDWQAELVPLPAEGAACGCTEDDALSRALLEACQARLTAISGAREDVTRQVYPSAYDRLHLNEWRQQLRTPSRKRKCPEGNGKDEKELAPQLERILNAFKKARARAVLVVPLLSDSRMGVHAVRVVAPPLRHMP